MKWRNAVTYGAKSRKMKRYKQKYIGLYMCLKV